jgi:hypothetical protein
MRQLVLFFVALFFALDGWALGFTVDGIYYTTTGESTVAVDNGNYSGAITIPSSVVYSNTTYTVNEIGNYAFNYYSDVTSITIPSSVTRIGLAAFRGCSGLITVDSNNTNYASKEGVLYDKNLTILIHCPTAVTGNYTIPSSVTRIEQAAFFLCDSLTSITISSSVTSIGRSVFEGCTGLTSISIPSSVLSIGENAFRLCTGLTSITIPSSVTRIENYAFYGCSGLTSISIPASVTSIGFAAFEGCRGLTSIIIPSSIKNIGSGTFKGCTGLTSMTIPSSVTSIGDAAFEGCTGMSSMTIPSSVTSIGGGAFRDCSGLITVDSINANYASRDGVLYDKNLTTLIQCPVSVVGNYAIPSSVTRIGIFAFLRCTGLTSITIPSSVKQIGSAAFEGCTGLTAVTIPSSVTSIGMGTFRGCTGLIDVTIPSSVTSIDTEAFAGCTGLTAVTTPSSVTSIGMAAFGGCTGLTSITIPSSVTQIGDGAFEGCTGLTSVTIPPSVTRIGNVTFSGCTGLTSITIPSSVTSIGNYAFLGCTGLDSITIPPSVTYIESTSFEECTGLITVDSCNANYSSKDGVLFDKMLTTLIKCLTSVTGHYTIPSSVTQIGGVAFRACTGLTSITIPPSVTQIGGGAFLGCTGLTSITISSSVTEIGGTAFMGCTGLTAVNIPSSVTSIGRDAFRGCAGMISVDASNTNYSSIDGILYDKNQTLLIQCPISVRGKLTVPSSVTKINEYAFSGCADLTAVELPSPLTIVGSYAFQNCKSLSSIKLNATTPPYLGRDAFSFIVYTKCVLYVPTGSLLAYQAASNWKNFSTILEFDPTGLSTINRSKLSIYPNPTQSHLTIELGEPSIKGQLIVLNAQGQAVYECQVSDERISLDVSHFPAGMYFIDVKGSDHQRRGVGKFIKR